MLPKITKITVFPVKSCDPRDVSESGILPCGALKHDRKFALVDSKRRFINAKRSPLIHQLMLMIDPERREYQVGRMGGDIELRGHLDERARDLSDWLSDFFSLDVSIIENDQTGFPDDTESPGPTIVSRATLETVAQWFAGMSVDEVRLRFRANIEIDGVEAFHEDRLFRVDRRPQPFRIGDVHFGGINPCQRCVVPTRDPRIGKLAPPSFAQRFEELRRSNLPPWAAKEHFDHFYRLSTNTQLIRLGSGIIRVGDPFEIVHGDE